MTKEDKERIKKFLADVESQSTIEMDRYEKTKVFSPEFADLTYELVGWAISKIQKPQNPEDESLYTLVGKVKKVLAEHRCMVSSEDRHNSPMPKELDARKKLFEEMREAIGYGIIHYPSLVGLDRPRLSKGLWEHVEHTYQAAAMAMYRRFELALKNIHEFEE